MATVFAFLGEEQVAGVTTDLDARSASVAGKAWWTHNALQPIRPVPEPGSALRQPQHAIVTQLTRRFLVEHGYPTGGSTDRWLGAAGWRLLAAADKARVARHRPDPPPEELDRLIERTVQTALSKQRR